jgi:hypothetical protein
MANKGSKSGSRLSLTIDEAIVLVDNGIIVLPNTRLPRG